MFNMLYHVLPRSMAHRPGLSISLLVILWLLSMAVLYVTCRFHYKRRASNVKIDAAKHVESQHSEGTLPQTPSLLNDLTWTLLSLVLLWALVVVGLY